MKHSLTALACFILISFAAGAIGGFFTASAIPTWYAGLAKPSFSPPNWLFGPVWALLYALMGIAAYLIFEKGMEKKSVKGAIDLFSGQLILNVAWSIIFFGFHSPLFAFICIILLWLAIAFTIRSFYAIDRRAAYLLAPYLLWVSFAAVLNLLIVLLNP